VQLEPFVRHKCSSGCNASCQKFNNNPLSKLILLKIKESWCQFHQHSTCSFYDRRFRMQKKDSQVSSVTWRFWDLLVYIKAACKTLVNLALGVNFTNILLANFLYESKLSSFSLLMLGFVFLAPKFCTKNACVKC